MRMLRVLLLAGGLGVAGMAAPTAAAIPGYLPCPSPGGLAFEVTGGVTCSDTWVFEAYDFEQGDKYQDIANFTCYSSTVEQKPVVLTCVSENGEFVASSV